VDPAKSFTAAEVMELLETNEIIRRSQEFLIEELRESHEKMMDDLIFGFTNLQISVPFRSDVDEGREEHQVTWGEVVSLRPRTDVIVQSNPKPLKSIIQAGIWENHILTAPIKTTLAALRKTAKLALYKIAGNAKRNIAGARTKGNMEA